MTFGVYMHVPFCSVRCGYCDFNTYTAAELVGSGASATRENYMDSAIAELDFMRARVDRRVETVFVGGGTPTQLAADDLVRFLGQLDLAPGAEVTTEANPDSVTPESLDTLRAGGFTRVSFGMQSAVPHVLDVLERTHDPARVPDAVRWAREAGFEQVSLDLIYGSPGESMEDWRHSVESALAMEPNHVSAYALIVEDGTAFARKVRRGEVVMPDDDETAEKYLLADDLFEAAGLSWYELSNWAVDDAARCHHNELYWRSDDWWGIGPGAHSHLGGERWWNVKHPAAYASRLATGDSPKADGEVVAAESRRLEDVLLRIRLREGIEIDRLNDNVAEVVAAGHATLEKDRLVLTREGRLMADHVVRTLT